jgi:hypothetical protein
MILTWLCTIIRPSSDVVQKMFKRKSSVRNVNNIMYYRARAILAKQESTTYRTP